MSCLLQTCDSVSVSTVSTIATMSAVVGSDWVDSSSLDSVESSTKLIGSSSLSSISSTEGSESLRRFALFKKGLRLSSTGELGDELELAS